MAIIPSRVALARAMKGNVFLHEVPSPEVPSRPAFALN